MWSRISVSLEIPRADLVKRGPAVKRREKKEGKEEEKGGGNKPHLPKHI